MRRLILAAAIGLLGLAGAADAHRGHHTLAIVNIAADGDVTVTHILSAHDTEPELVALAPDAQPSVDDPDALKALEDHLGAAFTVNGQALTIVSTDFKGDDLTLVFHTKLPAAPKTVTIEDDMFPDSASPHEGLVNIHMGGKSRSLQFFPGDGPKSVKF